jgi:hypothetical protein
MVAFDNRTIVLLVAGFVALATVPAAGVQVGATDPGPGESVGAAPTTVGGGTLAQETADNETTTDDETTTPADGAGSHAVEPLAPPERPDSLDGASAGEYVATYEEVRKHNELLARTTDVSITRITVGCRPRSVDEQADGFAVEVLCAFSYEFGENGTPTGVADGAPYSARYLVGENATELRGLWSALGDGAARPLPRPDKPETLTDFTTVAFAADYEEVRRHNLLLNETNATVTRADVLCEFAELTERDGAFVVDVACRYSYDFRTDGGAVGVAEGEPYTARYRITDTETELVDISVDGNATAPTTAGAERATGD